MIFFRNGDASMVYHTKTGMFEVCITKCGEMGFERSKNLSDLVKSLSMVYDFSDEQIFELIRGAEVEQDK